MVTSQFYSTGGGVRGRKTGWQLGMFEDTQIAIWRSDEVRRLLRAVWRARKLRPKIIFSFHRSCEPSSRERVTVANEKDIADCRACRHRTLVQVRDLGVRSFESARRWTCIFCLVELARRSIVWYILVWILAAGCLRSGILVRTGNEALRSWDAKSCR